MPLVPCTGSATAIGIAAIVRKRAAKLHLAVKLLVSFLATITVDHFPFFVQRKFNKDRELDHLAELSKLR